MLEGIIRSDKNCSSTFFLFSVRYRGLREKEAKIVVGNDSFPAQCLSSKLA